MLNFNLPEIPTLYETTKRWKWRQLAAFIVLALVLVLSVVIPEKTKPKVTSPLRLETPTLDSIRTFGTSPLRSGTFPKIKKTQQKQIYSEDYDFSNFN